MAWRDHRTAGTTTTTTAQGRWDGHGAVTGGGTRTAAAPAVVAIRGTNPTLAQVAAYFAGKPGAADFDCIVAQESRCRHFAADGLPVVSFDGGIGLCQLTDPAPTLAQAWDWRASRDAGLALFTVKRAAAERRLGYAGRRYTPVETLREAVCVSNGGTDHDWNGAA